MDISRQNQQKTKERTEHENFIHDIRHSIRGLEDEEEQCYKSTRTNGKCQARGQVTMKWIGCSQELKQSENDFRQK